MESWGGGGGGGRVSSGGEVVDQGGSGGGGVGELSFRLISFRLAFQVEKIKILTWRVGERLG